MRRKVIKRRTLVRIVSYLFALSLVLGGYTINFWFERRDLERYMEASYQHSFSELVENMSAIEHALQKGLYASSPTLISQLSTEVARASAGAQSMMAQLPFSFAELEDTARFLSQTGDWSSTLAKSAASGAKIGDEQRKTLQQLSESARSLALRLCELQNIVNEENLQIGALLLAEDEMESDEPNLFGSMFKEFAAELSGLPSMVYDGPFSTHMEQNEAKFVANDPELSQDEALQAALSFMDLQEGQLDFDYESNGTLPIYSFRGSLNGGDVVIQVSRKGGHIASMLSTAEPTGEKQIDTEEAIKRADAFLKEHGYDNMEHSYHMDSGRFLLVNYHYMDGDVSCYADLVKVGVSLETGEVTQFEALGYLQNHIPNRGLTPPTISADDAIKNAVIGDLTLETHREALIPSTRGELHCHELVCVTPDNLHLLIYVNVHTGIEEKIMVLIENESGTLAI